VRSYRARGIWLCRQVWQRDTGQERCHWHTAFNFWPWNATAELWPQIEAGRHTKGDIGAMLADIALLIGDCRAAVAGEYSCGRCAATRTHAALRCSQQPIKNHRLPPVPAPTSDRHPTPIRSNLRCSGGWLIEFSTLPWREGRCLEFDRSAGWERVPGSSTVATAEVLPAVLPEPAKL
jgi:hypothetical protein